MTLTDAFRRHPYLSCGFAIASLSALILAVSVGIGLLGWHRPAREPVAGWMTIGYVGRSFDVNPREIDRIAGFPTPEVAGHPLTLNEIAKLRGETVTEVIGEVEAALAKLGHHHGPQD
jgi:hypothetical protein